MKNNYAEVIGDPIAQSQSPDIHKYWLKNMGIVGDYSAQRVKSVQLADYFTERRKDPYWRGANITLPHKEVAIAHMDKISPAAKAVGAINIAYRKNGKLIGDNSDIDGIKAALEGLSIKGKTVNIIGAGGAASAALYTISKLNAGKINLYNRSKERAIKMAKQFPFDAAIYGLHDVLKGSILINASPLGMAGYPPYRPDLSPMREDAIIFDMVYNPLITPLIQTARSHSLHTIDGLFMLIGQAERAFSHFFGQTPPRSSWMDLRKLLIANSR